jgi:hypothetical protein
MRRMTSLLRRERRLARSFRKIVLAMIASPVAGTMGCQVPDEVILTDDASFADTSAPPIDASTDAPATPDATTVSCEATTIVDASFEDSPDGCAAFHYLPCGLPRDAQVSSCLVDMYTCVDVCGTTRPFLYCQLLNCGEGGIVPDSATILDCTSCNGIAGRRPLGLRAVRARACSPLGDYFASMAHLESASVRAFRDLERWLAAFDAPAHLTRAANRAASDERRHARAASRLARRFGGSPPRPRVRRVATPSLLTLLEDDAVEGCVGETFGALLATWQAERAEDPRVRRTLRRIAVDETRHAALAWEILGWGTPRLSARDRRRVQRTLDGALSTISRRPARPMSETARRIAGHPAPPEERLLLRQLTELVRIEARGAS